MGKGKALRRRAANEHKAKHGNLALAQVRSLPSAHTAATFHADPSGK
jgi:hypothetical protein